MRSMILRVAAASATLAFSGLLQPASAAVLIAVDEKAQTMTVAVDGVEAYHWKVSTGRSGYDTPTGNFRPFRAEVDHYSKEWTRADALFDLLHAGRARDPRQLQRWPAW